MAFMFEKLKVYQKSLDLADAVLVLTEKPRRGLGFLANQANRASVSIAANLAEGNARPSSADRANFFRIALGSAHECVPLLELMKRRKMIDLLRHDEMKLQIETIARMINGLIAGVEKRSREA